MIYIVCIYNYIHMWQVYIHVYTWVYNYIHMYLYVYNYISSVQSLSHVWLFVIPWIAAHQASLSITDSWRLLKLMSIESVMMDFCCSLLLLPHSFRAPGSFPVSQFFPSGSQNIGASASASVLPMNIRDWFPLGFTGRISLQSKRLSRVFSNTTVQKHQFFGAQLFFMVQLSHPYMTTGKIIALITRTLSVMSLLFNMLSRFVIAFLPRSKCLLISWVQSPSAVIFGAQENKFCHCFHCFPSVYHEVMEYVTLIPFFHKSNKLQETHS